MSKNQSQVTTLDDETPEKTAAPAAALKGANHDSALSGKTRTVTIHPNDSEGGSDAVFLSINGYAYQIPRGIPVDVPVEVIEVLNNARQTVMSFGQGGSLVERNTPRFAFSAN